jgi:hypothetical protein
LGIHAQWIRSELGITKRIHSFEIASLTAARLDYAKLRLCELGNQYFVDLGEEVHLAKGVYSSWGVDHVSIDLNGENGALVVDLDKPVPRALVGGFDVVTNYGTLEHANNQFQAFKNVHDICRVGGLMLHALPPPGHWPKHGRYYYPSLFPTRLAKACGYSIINLTQRNCYSDTRFANHDVILIAYLKLRTRFIGHGEFDRLPIIDTGDLSHTGNYTKQTTTESDPLSALLALYYNREDLQIAYPEVQQGDYARLLKWAGQVGEERIDAHFQLGRFATWYRDTRVKSQKDLTSDPLSLILYVYTERPDLQKAFPEVRNGNYMHLFDWAKQVLRDHDDAYEILHPFERWYNNNSVVTESDLANLRRLLEEKLSRQVARTEEIEKLCRHFEGELAHRQKELTDQRQRDADLQKEFSKLHQEPKDASSSIESLNTQLQHAYFELDSIKSSFGYRVMRFYGSRIDRAFPDDTRRGEFKKIIRESLRIATQHGVRRLVHDATEKIERREFKISAVMPPVVIQRPRKEPLESGAEVGTTASKLFLRCDTPILSPASQTKVPSTFVVSGWALAEQPIKEIRIYLDDSCLGSADYGIASPLIRNAHPNHPNSGRCGFQKLLSVDIIGAHNLRIEAVLADASSGSIEGLIEIGQTARGTHPVSIPPTTVSRVPGRKVRVIIQARRDSQDVLQIMERLRQQQGIQIPEITLISPGADWQELERNFDFKISQIPPEEAAVKLRASATGGVEIILYLLDDAIPVGKDFLIDIAGVLIDEPSVDAALPRQIPRSDADLKTCYDLWLQARSANISANGVLSHTGYGGICFRAGSFAKCSISHTDGSEPIVNIPCDNFRIAQVRSASIIHSHNWTPSQLLAESFVHRATDTRSSSKLDTSATLELNDLLNLSFGLYYSLNTAIDNLQASDIAELSIAETFRIVRTNIRKKPRSGVGTKNRCEDLEQMLNKIAQPFRFTEAKYETPNALTERYEESIEGLEEWLAGSRDDLVGLGAELTDTLYKLGATLIGQALGEFGHKIGDDTPDKWKLNLFNSPVWPRSL